MQTKEDIFNTLRDILSKDFEINADKASLHAHLYEDLGLDSIDAVDLIVRLQELTGKRIQPEQFKQVRTIQHVVDAVYVLLQENSE